MITIEEINGKKCSVIRRPFDAEWVREQLSMGIPVLVDDNIHSESGTELLVRRMLLAYPYCNEHFAGDGLNRWYGYQVGKLNAEGKRIHGQWTPEKDYGGFAYTLTILPALPRHPRPEHAPLLYRYMAEGLIPMATEKDFHKGCDLPNLPFISAWRDGTTMEITHCMFNGERVDIAIGGETRQ